MSRHASLFILAGLLLTATGCGPRGTDLVSRGAPERLLDVSSEVVNLGVKSSKEVDDLAQWVERDQPTRAELYCAEGELNCREAKQVLELYGIPNTMIPSGAGTVTLVYERVLARDCEQRFVDEQGLWYNENHPAFGCSVSANIVQHVTQKQQFISPNLSDFRDAETAVGTYNTYQSSAGQSLSRNAQQYGLGNSGLGNISQ